MGRGTSSAPWNESYAGMSRPPRGPAGLKANLERSEKVWVVNIQNTWMGVGKMTKSYEEVGDVGGSELRKNNEVVVGLDVPTLESSVPLEMRGVGRYLFEQILLRCNNSYNRKQYNWKQYNPRFVATPELWHGLLLSMF
jgi:hypothetical protein